MTSKPDYDNEVMIEKKCPLCGGILNVLFVFERDPLKISSVNYKCLRCPGHFADLPAD